MARLPVLKPREVVQRLEALGFSPLLFRQICKDIGLTVEEFLDRS